MLITLLGAIVGVPGAHTKGAKIGMYWVPLIAGVTKFLGLGIVWITG